MGKQFSCVIDVSGFGGLFTCSLPAINGLEAAKEKLKQNSEVTSLDEKKKEIAVIKIMKKACGVLILVAVGLIAKFM